MIVAERLWIISKKIVLFSAPFYLSASHTPSASFFLYLDFGHSIIRFGSRVVIISMYLFGNSIRYEVSNRFV